jgi:hypothetical protein
MDPTTVQSRGQLVAIELRIVPRPGNRAHIDHSLDSVRLEQPQKLFYRAGGVADRKDREPRHIIS